uniref:hypothetical protein n=1 Tax=Lactobacillus acidophilus TaxID=1579 RepID=UPI003F55D835
MNHWKEFMNKWVKSNVEPKNVVQVKKDDDNLFFLISYVEGINKRHYYTATNFLTGKIITTSDNINMLGHQLRNKLIPANDVQLVMVYDGAFDWADGYMIV